MQLKLRGTIVSAVVGLLLSAWVSGFIALRQQEERLLDQLLADHARLTDILAAGIQQPLWKRSPEVAQPLFESLMGDERVVSAVVRDAKYSVFLTVEHPTRRVGRQYTLRRDVVREGEVIGEVYVEIDSGKGDAEIVDSRKRLLFTMLGQLLFSMVVIVGLLRVRFLAPARDSLQDVISERTAELVAARDRAERAREEAEQANKAKSRFLAAASHDLRQPLHSLALFASALDEYVSVPEGRQVVNNIQRSLNALEASFTALFDVSRLDAGVVHPDIRDFRLGELIERLRNDYETETDQKGLTLHCQAGDFAVRSDPLLLERILRNLLSNAVRYTERGGVVLSAGMEDGHVRISVADTGVGIPRDKHQEIFCEFHQLESPVGDGTKGFGLGLAIVERLAGLLGYRIEVDSEPGLGSVFSVTVPAGDAAKVDPVDSQAGARVMEAVSLGNFDLKDLLVLVIEDKNDVLEGMQTLLRQWGCRPLLVNSEDEAIEQLRILGQPPDVIIADYRLAGERTGAQAIRRVQQEYGEAIAALITTANTVPDRLREAAVSGYSLLHKPVSPAQLRTFLSRARMAAVVDVEEG